MKQRKIITWVLVLLMALSLFSAAAFAEETEDAEESALEEITEESVEDDESTETEETSGEPAESGEIAEEAVETEASMTATFMLAAENEPASAANLDLSDYASTSASGDGWDWNADTLTLTLTDLTLTGGDSYATTAAIILPTMSEAATITVKLNGTNSISNFGQLFFTNTKLTNAAVVNLILTGTSNDSMTFSGYNYVSNGTFADVTIERVSFTATAELGWLLSGTFAVEKKHMLV